MKARFIFIFILSAFCFLSASAVKTSRITTVYFDTHVSGPIYFQQESDSVTGYRAVKAKQTMKLSLVDPTYYYYVDSKGHYYTVILTPGSYTKIVEDAKHVSIEGDNAKLNKFIQTHPCISQASYKVEGYSKEWLSIMRRHCEDNIQSLKSSKLPESFIRIHSAYYRYFYLLQLLKGPDIIKMFQGITANLPDGYYKDAIDETFSDEAILCYPKWYTVICETMTRLEKLGIIKPDYLDFLHAYATRIKNENVRKAYLLRHLDFLLTNNYTDDFPHYISIAKDFVGADKEANEKLSLLESKYNKMRDANKQFIRGTKALNFSAQDINGKTYSLSDFSNKVVVLDFWFSGCIPCKAEMPYMKLLAEKLRGENIQFMTISFDSTSQLIDEWKALVNKHVSQDILQLNMKEGFKSDVAKYYNMHSVPRIILIDKDGKIVDPYARRPSDPKLYNQIMRILKNTHE